MMIDIENLQKNETNILHFKSGQIIIQDGDIFCDKMYILLNGTVDVFKNYQKPGEIKIATLSQGDFFGEMSLFLNKARTATVIACEDVTTFTIDHTNVIDFFGKQPDIVYLLIQNLCSRLDNTNNKMSDNHIQYEEDIISLNNENSELQIAANVDALTGIYNRRYFMDTAETRIKYAIKENKNAFITIFDLDLFKKVNDTYGHQAGDAVLKSVADIVSRSIRSYDLFARYGGEEFVLLTTDIHKEAVLELIERIQKNIRKEPIKYEGVHIAISASFGIASISSEDTFSMALSFADEALYRAKNEGRDRVVFYEQVLNLPRLRKSGKEGI